MGQRVAERCGDSSLQFNKRSFSPHCQSVLRALRNCDDHYQDLLQNYVSFTVKPSKELLSLLQFHPRLAGGQMQDQIRKLALLLCEVYRTASYEFVIECNRKINKHVMNSRWGRLVDGKVQQQVAVAHNKHILRRDMDKERVRFEYVIDALKELGPADNDTVLCRGRPSSPTAPLPDTSELQVARGRGGCRCGWRGRRTK